MQEIARIQIDAAPQAVFDLIADNTRRGEWAEGMETFDYTSDFDPNDAVGTTFTQRIREGGRVTEYHGEITAYDPPKAWGAKVVGGSCSMVVEYHLTRANGGTRGRERGRRGLVFLVRPRDGLPIQLVHQVARSQAAPQAQGTRRNGLTPLPTAPAR